MASWAKKKLAKFTIYKFNRPPLLPRIESASTVSISQIPLAHELVLAAELGCPRCRKRVTDAISSIGDVKSMAVHVTEKKVILNRS